MTKKQARILIGTIFAFLIIGAGLFTGWFFSTHKIVSIEEKTAQAQKKAEPNFNTYDISPPSRATTLQTRDFAIRPIGDTASVTIPKKDASEIKTGQRVLLYKTGHEALETLGEVSAVRTDAGETPDNVTIIIKLHGDENIDVSQAEVASIVINRIPASPRLPLSALVQNGKGEPYVWEAVQGRDGTSTAYLKRIYVAAATHDFFVIAEQSHQGGDYILNPDAALRDGQKINVQKTRYAGPPQTDDNRIEMLMADRRREREARRAMEEMAAAQAAEASNAGSNGCATTPNYAQDFIDKIRSMSDAPPTASGPSSLPANTP